ncbi:hypothetical protein ACMAUO_06190 [Gluconacetobacter sp. Hr-1-5]|uniref:hypothetical protein n=1 Tax=Gluconacetobacter sp. Hr-1-5 TaxID=3395370 RepID=UPI003B519484
MQICGFGWQNRVLDATLTADAQAARLPVSNLRNQQGAPSLGWRTPGTAAGLALSLSAAAPLRAISLHRTNLTALATWTVTVSSGGQPVWTTNGGPIVGGQSVVVAPATLAGDTVRLTISDPTNPDGWLDVPLAYVGPLWQPVRNFSTDSTTGRALGQDSLTSLAGTEFVDARWYQRTASIAHQSLGDADSAVIEQILRVAATGQNILFLPDPGADSGTLARQALFGRLSGADLSNPFGAADRHAITLTMTERL